jgi:hypothetical protein
VIGLISLLASFILLRQSDHVYEYSGFDDVHHWTWTHSEISGCDAEGNAQHDDQPLICRRGAGADHPGAGFPAAALTTGQGGRKGGGGDR